MDEEQEVFHIIITWDKVDRMWNSDDTADYRVPGYSEACRLGSRAAVDVLEALLPNGPPRAAAP